MMESRPATPVTDAEQIELMGIDVRSAMTSEFGEEAGSDLLNEFVAALVATAVDEALASAEKRIERARLNAEAVASVETELAPDSYGAASARGRRSGIENAGLIVAALRSERAT